MDQNSRPFTFGGASTQPAFGTSSAPTAPSFGAGSLLSPATGFAFGTNTASRLFGRPNAAPPDTSASQSSGNLLQSGSLSTTNANPSTPFGFASNSTTNSPQTFRGFPNLAQTPQSTPAFGAPSLFPSTFSGAQTPPSGGFSFGGGFGSKSPSPQPAALTFGIPKQLESAANQPANLSFGTKSPLPESQPASTPIIFGSGTTKKADSGVSSSAFKSMTAAPLTFGVQSSQAGLLGPGPKQQEPFTVGKAAKAFGSLAALNELENAQGKRKEIGGPAVKTISMGGKSEENESEKERKKSEREKRFGKQALAEVPVTAAPSVRPASVREAEPELDLPSMRHGPIMGTCQEMCHKEERDRRARDKQLDVFERVDGDPERTSAELCVRKFSRNISESGRAEPEHMRPVPVLRRTMDYLLSLADIPYDDRLLEVYRFLWDRTRGIRQDLAVQDIKNAASIQMHEEMIRFHILGAHELCDQKATPDNFDGFNPQQNIEQTAKALTSLFDMYNTHAREGVFFDTEPEFRAYYLLLILETHAEHFKVEQGQTNQFLRGLRPEILRSSDVHFAIRVRRTREMRNHVRYFRLLEEATYLQACLMHIYFGIVRGEALDTIKRVHRQPGDAITVEELQNDLGMDEDEVAPFLEHYGLSLVALQSGQSGLRLSREERFEAQSKPPAARHSSIVAAKRAEKVIQDVLHSGLQVMTSPSKRGPPSPLSVGVPAYTASRPPLSPPKNARPSSKFREAPPSPTFQQPAEPLDVQAARVDEAEAQKALEVRQAEEKRAAEIEKMKREIAEKEKAEARARVRAEERWKQLEAEEKKKREEEEKRKWELEERKRQQAEQARLRKEAERRRIEEEARRKAALEEEKRRQKAALQRLVVFLCKKSSKEREQERIREEQRVRAQRAERALATVSARNVAKPSEEVARLYEAAAREERLLSSTLFELERLQAEIAAQREARWAPLGNEMVSAIASGLQTHSSEARCLAFKLVVSTGLDRSSSGAKASIQEAASFDQQRRTTLAIATKKRDEVRRIKGSAERPSVFERLGKHAAEQRKEKGNGSDEAVGRADNETGLWLRAKFELEKPEGEIGSKPEELKLGEGVFEVSQQSHVPTRRQYLWLLALESETESVDRRMEGSSALVFFMQAANAGDVKTLRKDRERLEKLVQALPEGAEISLLVVVAASKDQWTETTEDEREASMERSNGPDSPENDVEMDALYSPREEGPTGMELVPLREGRTRFGGEAKDLEEDFMEEEETDWELEEDLDGADTAVGNALGLDGLGVDDARVADWRAIFVREEVDASATNQLLLKGLHWLAETSHPQPLLKPLNLPDLVKSFLILPLQALGPVDCIAAFNHALQNAESALNKALAEALKSWPPSETESYEGPRKWALQILPRVDWRASDAAIQRLRAARLPSLEGSLERVRVEETTEMQSNVNNLLAKIMGGEEKDVAVVKQSKRLLERGQIEYDSGGEAWYRPDWRGIFQEIFQVQLSSLHDLPPTQVYVKPSDLPPEATPSSPLEEEQDLVRYIEEPGSFLLTTSEDDPAAQGAESPMKIMEEGSGPLMDGQTDGLDDKYLSPEEGAQVEAAEAFGSTLSGRVFNRAGFFASRELAAPLMIAEPIQEGRIFVAQNLPRGPIRGSLVQPRRLRRVFSGVAQESGMMRKDDVMMTSSELRFNERMQEEAGIGVKRANKQEAIVNGTQNSDQKLQEGAKTTEERPIGASDVTTAEEASRVAANLVGGSGSGTTGATRSPLKRKGLFGEDEKEKKAKLELDSKLEALKVYAESTVQEAVETAAGIAEALLGPRKRKSLSRVAGSFDERRDGKRLRDKDCESPKDVETNKMGLDARQEENIGGGHDALNGDAILSPEERFSAAVARIEAAFQLEDPVSRLADGADHDARGLLDVAEPSSGQPHTNDVQMAERQGNARAVFEEVTRRTLEVLGSCASNEGAENRLQWESSPPLRAR